MPELKQKEEYELLDFLDLALPEWLDLAAYESLDDRLLVWEDTSDSNGGPLSFPN